MLCRNVKRILAYRHPVHQRKQFDGLIAIARNLLREDPLDGSPFLFVNRRGNYIKGVFLDRTGFFLIAKRLDQGRFHFPGDVETRIERTNNRIAFGRNHPWTSETKCDFPAG